jgi:hypothetical protein
VRSMRVSISLRSVKVGDHFATMLEKAIARSQAPLKQIELKPYDGPVLEPRPRGIHGRSGEGQR